MNKGKTWRKGRTLGKGGEGKAGKGEESVSTASIGLVVQSVTGDWGAAHSSRDKKDSVYMPGSYLCP